MKKIQVTALILGFFSLFTSCNNSNTVDSPTVTQTTDSDAPEEQAPPTLENFSLRPVTGDVVYAGAYNPMKIQYANIEHLVLEEGLKLEIIYEDSSDMSNFTLLAGMGERRDTLHHITVTDTVLDITEEIPINVQQIIPVEEIQDRFTISLGGNTGGEITREALKNLERFSVEIKDYPLKIQNLFSSCDLYYQRKGGDPAQYMLSGTGLVSERKNPIDGEIMVHRSTVGQLFEKARAGDKFTFTRLKVTFPGAMIKQRVEKDFRFTVVR